MERPIKIGSVVLIGAGKQSATERSSSANDRWPLGVGRWLCCFGQRPSANSQREAGFTLAGVIVLVTIVMIFAAYTVPRQWSAILQRDREKQTIFIMKQYAIAISAFQEKNKTWPVSIDQLEQARQPRFLRGPKDGYIDPLTGAIDWLIIPASAVGATGQPLPNPSQPQTDTAKTTTPVPGIPIKDYAGGPFIGVRPNKSGKSMLEFRQQQTYDAWMYTAFDYRTDRDARRNAAAKKWQ
jgi:type II secretory pathway pseudopilin PulG